MHKNKSKLELTPAQQAAIADALKLMICETREAYAEFEDMTLEEWRALKEWWRRRPTGRGPTEYPDPYLWDVMQQVLRKARADAKPIGRGQLYKRIAALTDLHWTTVRDRIIRIERDKNC